MNNKYISTSEENQNHNLTGFIRSSVYGLFS